jgi:hypothetical protein
MKLAILALVLFPALARAEGDATVTPKSGVPVETVKVTDQPDAALFDRVRDAHVRAEKKGLLAVATNPAR